MNIEFSWNWPELEEAFFTDEKYVTISAGRGAGKTYNAFNWICEELLCTDAQSGLWVDTIQNNIDSYVETYLQRAILKDLWQYCDYSYKRKRLTLPGDKYIQFVSAEKPENAEGFRFHRVVLNEAGIILKKASLWDNSIEPMTNPRDGENKTRLVGTMKGKNRFFELNKQFKSFHFTIYDSPNYTEQEVEEIKKRTPEHVFQQEYMSIPLDGTGAVFRNIGKNFVNRRDDDPIDGKNYYMSVDLAKHQDFTVVLIGDLDTKEVVFMDRFNKIDWGFQKKRIVSLYERFNCSNFIIDSTGVGDAIFDDLANLGLSITSFKFTSSSKTEIVRNLSVAIDNQEIKYYPFKELVDELEVFTYSTTPSGNVKYEAPPNLHDDCVMALAMLNHLFNDYVPFEISFI